mgnify:CR=1 FL=1
MKDNFWKIIFWAVILVGFLLWKGGIALHNFILKYFDNYFVFIVFATAVFFGIGNLLSDFYLWQEKNKRDDKKPPSNNSGTYNG